jgi:hypothetical protein
VSAEGANQPGSGVRVPRTLPPVSAEGANQLFVPALKDASFPRVCLKARRRRGGGFREAKTTERFAQRIARYLREPLRQQQNAPRSASAARTRSARAPAPAGETPRAAALAHQPYPEYVA